MYKKAWCTCKVVVLLIKPIVFFTFLLLFASLDLKVPNDFGATSVTKRSCCVPISEVERHVSDRVRTVIRTVVKVNNWEEDWNPLRRKKNFRSGDWELVHQTLSANRSGTMFDVCKRLAPVLRCCCS